MTGKARHFAVKRVYDPAAEGDGLRVLVDRLWPRGLTKQRAAVDLWLKAVSPSDALRRQFHGDPSGWDAFLAAYAAELALKPAHAAAEELRGKLRDGPVTLLYASRDEARNNAVALTLLLEG